MYFLWQDYIGIKSRNTYCMEQVQIVTGISQTDIGAILE